MEFEVLIATKIRGFFLSRLRERIVSVTLTKVSGGSAYSVFRLEDLISDYVVS
jgi:hypothetical protein